jgi:hypothetical protein
MGLPAESPSPARHGRPVHFPLYAVVVACMGLLGVLGGLMVAGAPSASAAVQGCGSLGSGTSVFIGRPGACVVPPASEPYATFTDGEKVDLAMGPNSIFSPHDGLGGDVEALECQYRTASGLPGDPPNANYCDAQTTAADFPFAVNQDGSFDYSTDNNGDKVVVFALPDKTLPLASAIKCNATHACVWYVGESYNNFTSPHVFSSPFFVGAAASAGGSGSSLAVIIIVVVIVAAAAVVFRFVLVPRRRRLARRSR